jgi:hypothetical protein
MQPRLPPCALIGPIRLIDHRRRVQRACPTNGVSGLTPSGSSAGRVGVW